MFTAASGRCAPCWRHGSEPALQDRCAAAVPRVNVNNQNAPGRPSDVRVGAGAPPMADDAFIGGCVEYSGPGIRAGASPDYCSLVFRSRTKTLATLAERWAAPATQGILQCRGARRPVQLQPC